MEDWQYREARRRVRKVKKFYNHFISWIVFSAFFIFLNFTTSPNDFWAIFPIMGWGIGVVFHAIGVFGIPGLGKDWESRMMERELDRIAHEKEIKEWERQQKSLNSPSAQEFPEEPPMRLKELRNEWKDSDLV